LSAGLLSWAQATIEPVQAINTVPIEGAGGQRRHHCRNVS
jgi:hypothetical protein